MGDATEDDAFGAEERWALAWVLWRDFFGWLAQQSNPAEVNTRAKLDLLSQFVMRAEHFGDAANNRDVVRARIYESLCAYFSQMPELPSASTAHRILEDAQRRMATIIKSLDADGEDKVMANMARPIQDACRGSIERTLLYFVAMQTYITVNRARDREIVLAMSLGRSVGDIEDWRTNIRAAEEGFTRLTAELTVSSARARALPIPTAAAAATSPDDPASPRMAADSPPRRAIRRERSRSMMVVMPTDDSRATSAARKVSVDSTAQARERAGSRTPTRVFRDLRKRVGSMSHHGGGRRSAAALEALERVQVKRASLQGDELQALQARRRIEGAVFAGEVWALLVTNDDSSSAQTAHALGTEVSDFLEDYTTPVVQRMLKTGAPHLLTVEGAQARVLYRVLDAPLNQSEFLRTMFWRAASNIGTPMNSVPAAETALLRLKTVSDKALADMGPQRLRAALHPRSLRLTNTTAMLICLTHALAITHAATERRLLEQGVITYRNDQINNLLQATAFVRALTSFYLNNFKKLALVMMDEQQLQLVGNRSQTFRMACPGLTHSNSAIF